MLVYRLRLGIAHFDAAFANAAPPVTAMQSDGCFRGEPSERPTTGNPSWFFVAEIAHGHRDTGGFFDPPGVTGPWTAS
ncbi:hypothetical protein [Zestomonas carbonaria]|uniref:hypothetical protein n=1 Tax=Zestomonas carbonaria TaxID=2762745 RepID=UPI001657470B|nr:hypothetical protein [Pseudomonas carbonaria]